MKKFYMMFMSFIVVALLATGCDVASINVDGEEEARICVVYDESGQCMAYTTIPEATPAEDGLSAYELAVQQGYTGTLDEWLASLVGNDGEDGICSECVIDDNETVEPEIIPDGVVLMTFQNTAGFTNAKIAHTVDGYLVSIEDVEVVDLNGSFLAEGNLTIDGEGIHGIGLMFDVVEPEPEPEPVI